MMQYSGHVVSELVDPIGDVFDLIVEFAWKWL